MISWGRRRQTLLLLVLVFFLGCTVPSSASPPLTAETAQKVLNSWNPSYCKVLKFYGFYTPAPGNGNTRIAYVLLATPSGKNQRQTVYAARFQLLSQPQGLERWFLVSLVSHSSGLHPRQGWDNLMVPVEEIAPGPTR
jgi:hypothetical protein